MRFVDLFAGLGGFHVALQRLGHECVFACEIDERLRAAYAQNFHIEPWADIRSIVAEQVPDHDVLCAGFPCQPFSKAGRQLGFDCPHWGDLFSHVARLIAAKRPPFIMLENVPHLAKHDGGRTWEQLKERLEGLGYQLRDRRLSPHVFGIPQVRERLFIVGSLQPLDAFDWPDPVAGATPNIIDLLETSPTDARQLPAAVEECLAVWQEFLDQYPLNEELPSWPIWSMEFGADYPYEEVTPGSLSPRQLCAYRGSHGIPLRDCDANERLDHLPSYARGDKLFPRWKQNFIARNRGLYERHRKWLRWWIPKIKKFPASYQKLEWNCRGETRNIWKYLIQFRASGVRVKRPTSAPSLIAMTITQVPIVGWERRYLTPRECSRLQGLKEIVHLPTIPSSAYGALGNAVNADLVEMIAEGLVGRVPPVLRAVG